MNLPLFHRPDLKIVRLRESDARRDTDHLRSFRNLVLQSEAMYPSISKWLYNRVIPGLRSSERTAFVAYLGGEPFASALIKKSTHTKFCHLKIRDDYQGLHLGEVLFCLMAIEVRNVAQDIHFTLPESLWERESGFFRSFAFERVVTAGTQYRLFDRELLCAAPFTAVYGALLKKLPRLGNMHTVAGFSMDNHLLMSIQPRYALQILQGTKVVEIRRRFSERWVGARASLYASNPVKAIVGEVTIGRVVSGEPSHLWDEFGFGAGCSKEEYDIYVAGSKEVSIVFLEDVRPYPNPVSLAQIRELIDDEVRPPQSYCLVDAQDPWGKAMTIAALMHGVEAAPTPHSTPAARLREKRTTHTETETGPSE